MAKKKTVSKTWGWWVGLDRGEVFEAAGRVDPVHQQLTMFAYLDAFEAVQGGIGSFLHRHDQQFHDPQRLTMHTVLQGYKKQYAAILDEPEAIAVVVGGFLDRVTSEDCDNGEEIAHQFADYLEELFNESGENPPVTFVPVAAVSTAKPTKLPAALAGQQDLPLNDSPEPPFEPAPAETTTQPPTKTKREKKAKEKVAFAPGDFVRYKAGAKTQIAVVLGVTDEGIELAQETTPTVSWCVAKPSRCTVIKGYKPLSDQVELGEPDFVVSLSPDFTNLAESIFSGMAESGAPSGDVVDTVADELVDGVFVTVSIMGGDNDDADVTKRPFLSIQLCDEDANILFEHAPVRTVLGKYAIQREASTMVLSLVCPACEVLVGSGAESE